MSTKEHIEIVKTPDVLGGKPRIDGVRVGVLQVGDLVRELDEDIETVMSELRLSRGQVEAALDYYDAHPDEMDAERARDEWARQQVQE